MHERLRCKASVGKRHQKMLRDPNSSKSLGWLCDLSQELSIIKQHM